MSIDQLKNYGPDLRPVRLVTHDGVMHADEVMATAILRMVFPKSTIKRTRDPDEIKSGEIVYDVGGVFDPHKKRFDHHFKNPPLRSNGVPFSSAGLVWQEFGERLLTPPIASPCTKNLVAFRQKWIDENMILPICMVDTGAKQQPPDDHPMHKFISAVDSVNPTWQEGPDYDSNSFFDEAVERTQVLLTKVMKSSVLTGLSVFPPKTIPAVVNAKLLDTPVAEFVRSYEPHLKHQQDAIESARANISRLMKAQAPSPTLILDENYPWDKIVDPIENPHLAYIVFPAKNDWRIQAVPKAMGSFELQHPLPEEWRGKQRSELTNVVPTMTFCHPTGFIAGASSRADALKLAEIAASRIPQLEMC